MRIITAIAWLLISLALLTAVGTVIWAVRVVHRPAIPQVPLPPSVVSGAPSQPLRIVSYNILHNRPGQDAIVAEIRRLAPDIVLLQEVESRDIGMMSQQLKAIHMAYFPSQNLAGNASWGNAILSKTPLYEAATIPNPGGGSFGVWAYVVVNNKKFMVACVHLAATWNANPKHLIDSSNARYKELTNLRNAWTLAGEPPIVIGGDFNQLPLGNNYELMTRDWSDALGRLGKTGATFHDGFLHTRIDYFLMSREFEARDGAVVGSAASDHSPVWVEIGQRR